MEAINSFSNGMNSDISKQIHSKDSYVQALNFRPLTELGSSNGSLVNIKGNECKLTFPDLQPVYKIIVTPGTLDSSNDTTIVINGVSKVYPVNNVTTGLDLYNYIVANYQNCYKYSGALVATKTFDIAYDNDYIIIYQQPVYTNCTTVASVNSTITLTPTTSDGTQGTLYFVNHGVANSLTQNTTKPYVAGVSSANIIAIGSTFILNDIYILTAPLGTTTSNDELQTPGTIWKLNIDDITKQHTLTLVYSNNLDFTENHPIPPSAITGRYESLEIQRIYWSDNYNKIRVLNCTQPQLMALDPTQLSVMPKVEYVQAILNSIGTASPGLPAGCFQAAYRLSKVLGSVTNYSELSNPIYLTTSAEGDPFQDYQGSLGASGKSITWSLTGLDMNYDQIEFIVTYRDSESAVPVITSLGTTTLIEDMTFTYSDTTVTTYTEVTLEEFLLFNGTFTHAKTCDTKDNRLFWGNVRAPRKNLEIFDARAFRSNAAGEIKLKNSGVSADYLTVAAAAALPETSDTINEYYDSSGDYNAAACYLKPSTVSDPQPELGGEGVNIQYSFGTWTIQSDNQFVLAGGSGYDIGTPTSPFRNDNTDSGTITLTDYVYPQNNKFYALKQPEKTSLLRGFQHEEIYRFAFQAFDKQGNPYFSKWIGDIKMPSYGDYNHHPDATALAWFTAAGIDPDFRLSYSKPFPFDADQFQQILYIKFDIDISLIKDIIGGYQIVRVKRDGNNKTIWGSGMINPFWPDDSNDLGSVAVLPASWDGRKSNFTVPTPATTNLRYYAPAPSQACVETLNSNGTYGNFDKWKMFDSFDMDIGFRPAYAAGDKILIRSRLKCMNYSGATNTYRAFNEAAPNNPKNFDSGGNPVPPATSRINDGSYGTAPGAGFFVSSNNDMLYQPFFIMKMVDSDTYCNYTDFLGTNSNDYTVDYAQYINGNTSISRGGYDIHNYGHDCNTVLGAGQETDNPCFGKQTLFLEFTSNLDDYGNYGCVENSSVFKKLLALYYKPNPNLYNGATYAARSTNEYIPCGEYISTNRNNANVNTTVSAITFGGDVFTTIYDMMKTVKPLTGGSEYWIYEYNSSGVLQLPLKQEAAQFSTSFFFPCTVMHNSELRLGNHPNTGIMTTAGYNNEDDYAYNTYCNAENDTKVYFPQPLNFQNADEWINRIYWSELKFNNEPLDSWSVYLTDSFYDVEGNYGGINALISLKENMYYLQDRGVGMLLINPVSMINDQNGTPIKLGAGSEVIQKHFYKAIDAGTVHQWSVYRSQSTITFVDARHKKIYLFNGESVTPVSDVKGQRNFVIKRLHNELLKNDNPVINKGIITTYDYYHNEFLYTFNNVKQLTVDPITYDTTNDENLTLAYSEVLDAFTGMYSFTPNLYINSNKYLISTNSANKLWFHNYGNYGLFYNTQYPSTLKLLVNDNPLYTKIFDNSTWNSESIKDNVEWNDDLNVYPGSPTLPSYPDDVNHQSDTFTKLRCYNDWQNTDWLTLTTVTPNNTLTRKERNFNVQIPRNKFDYDSTAPSLVSLFNPTNLTKTLFGERIRDKYMMVDLYYPNTIGNRFIIHNFKTQFRISDR